MLMTIICGAAGLGFVVQIFRKDPKKKTKPEKKKKRDKPKPESRIDKVHRCRQIFFENMERGMPWSEANELLIEELGADDDLFPYTGEEKRRMQTILVTRGKEYGIDLTDELKEYL